MKPITKIVERSEDCYIQFTEEEMEQLDIKPKDKFTCKVNDDGSVSFEKYVNIEIDFESWDKNTLLFLIEESCKHQIPVDEVIQMHLEQLIKSTEDGAE